jgi:hypothetical protein
MAQWIELHVPGVAALHLDICSASTIVGTGPESSLRVPSNTGFASRHLHLTANAFGLSVTVDASVNKGFFHEGSQYRSLSMPWGSEIFVGSVRVVFFYASDHVTSAPRFMLLALTFISGLTGIAAYEFRTVPEASPPPFDAAVVDDIVGSACLANGPQAAEQRAIACERAASAKQQRFGFDPRDGVEALSQLRQSEVCFRIASRVSDASRIHAEANSWLQTLNTEYSTVRLRLWFNLEHNRTVEAIETINELQGFVPVNRHSLYEQWLVRTRETLMKRLPNSPEQPM